MTQTQLAEKLGVRFQQIQKYENGKNRISASRLFLCAQALDVPVESFFEGIDNQRLPARVSTVADSDLLDDRDAATFLRSLRDIPADQRRRLIHLAQTMAS